MRNGLKKGVYKNGWGERTQKAGDNKEWTRGYCGKKKHTENKSKLKGIILLLLKGLASFQDTWGASCPQLRQAAYNSIGNGSSKVEVKPSQGSW